MSPYKTRLELCRDKWGESSDETTEAMERGKILEPLTAQLYRRVTGNTCVDGTWVVSDEHPFMADTVDLLDKSFDCIVQLKTSTSWARHKWGEPGTNDIPDDYTVQGQHEMIVTKSATMVFGVLFADQPTMRALVYMVKAGMDLDRICDYVDDLREDEKSLCEFALYHIDRDEALCQSIIEAERTFWTDFVLAKVLPPDATIPEKSSKMVAADTTQADVMRKYFECRDEEKVAKVDKEEWQTQIETMIGEKFGIAAQGVGKATYKAPSPKPKTNWESVARGMRSENAKKFDDLKEEFTETKQGKRVFRAYPAKA
jgi:putative phage-type endonuclease